MTMPIAAPRWPARAEIQFVDSATPEDIPSGMFSHACYYADGLYAWPRAQVLRFKPRHAITVTGEASCGIADYEPGNPVYEDYGALDTWAHHRALRKRPARVYCDRNNASQALRELNGQQVMWWIATLDDRRWTAEELSADLAAHFGADIPADAIWGCQFEGGESADYDTSDLFKTWW